MTGGRPTWVWQKNGLVAHGFAGGLYLEHAGEGLLLDAPYGAAAALDEVGGLPRLRAIALSGGRILSVGGLPTLLCALEPHRTSPLSIWAPMGEERPALLADAWSRGWPDRYPLVIDTEAPGGELAVGAFELRTFAIRRGDPRWRPPRIDVVVGVAFRVTAGGATVAWVAGAGPGGVVSHVCRGADLAVVEAGVLPWPPSDVPWRLSVDQAVHAASEAGEVWIVGDDGRPVVGGQA